MDLSKAFDCLPHRLLITKMNAYGISKQSCTLVASYLTNREQRVKLGHNRSEWLTLKKGAPQGSVFGPHLYNVFTNDLLVSTARGTDKYNYADDNTVAAQGKEFNKVKVTLEKALSEITTWFVDNYMKANPSKYQAIVFEKRNELSQHRSFSISGTELAAQQEVTLLGIQLDARLTFGNHISSLCKKAGKSLNVLGRVSKSMDVDSKRTLFHSFILLHFNYYPVVWHFCDMKNMRKIEKIQERALRYVFNDFRSEYAELRKRAGRPLLYVERLRCISLEVYKSINKIGPSYLQDMYNVKENNYILKNGPNLCMPRVKTTAYGHNSLKYQGSKLWNMLNKETKLAKSAKQFKTTLSTSDVFLCHCNSCTLCNIANG